MSLISYELIQIDLLIYCFIVLLFYCFIVYMMVAYSAYKDIKP